MIEVTGNLWDYPANVRIITTNGSINSKGECVMGRGCAREAKERFPVLPKLLGDRIKAEGNHPYEFEQVESLNHLPFVCGIPEGETYLNLDGLYRRTHIITFPVKHKWFELADPVLIRTSALQLNRMLEPDKIYVMPRPGCGNGKRSWQEIKPLLLDLPDNVHVITFPPPAKKTAGPETN